MDARHWLPPLVFLGVSVPTVWLLHALEIGGEYRLFIAMGVGALATAMVQSRLRRPKD